MHLHLEPHHQRNLCQEQQGRLRQGGHLVGGASPETGGLSPAHVPPTERRGSAVYSNRIPQHTVVTRRAAAEPTGAVTRYRGVRPSNNNNSNNQGALAELFHPSTLHELLQLGIYINMDTPDTAHQLDAKAAAAEPAYTMTNTQPSCLGGGKYNLIPNNFKETMDLPQAARWKKALDNVVASLEKHSAFELLLII